MLTSLGHRAFLRLPTLPKNGPGPGRGLTLRRPVLMMINSASGGAPRTLVVEPRFAESFQLPKSTPRYDRVLGLLPRAFVGGPDVLKSLLQVIAREVSAVFDAANLTLPPWRRLASLQDRFFPANYSDSFDLELRLRVSRASASEAAAAAGGATGSASPSAHSISEAESESESELDTITGSQLALETSLRRPLVQPATIRRFGGFDGDRGLQNQAQRAGGAAFEFDLSDPHALSAPARF